VFEDPLPDPVPDLHSLVEMNGVRNGYRTFSLDPTGVHSVLKFYAHLEERYSVVVQPLQHVSEKHFSDGF
jgi:hypothetical protein